MKALPESIQEEFGNQGHWVVSKTKNAFSSIPIDQAHEQENAYVKGSGGVYWTNRDFQVMHAMRACKAATTV